MNTYTNKARQVEAIDWEADSRRLACDHNALQILAKSCRWTFEFAHALASFKLLGMDGSDIYLPVHDRIGGRAVDRQAFPWQGGSQTFEEVCIPPMIIGDASVPPKAMEFYESPSDAFAVLHSDGWNGEKMEGTVFVTFGRRLHPSLVPSLKESTGVSLWLDDTRDYDNGETEQWIDQVRSSTSSEIFVIKAPPKACGVRGWAACLRRHGRRKTRWLSWDALMEARLFKP